MDGNGDEHTFRQGASSQAEEIVKPPMNTDGRR
jgi:hypothetical protein